MQPLTDVFAPVFFVYVGISLDLSQLNLSPYSLLLLLAMILLAFIGKLAAGLVVSGTWRQKLIVGSAWCPEVKSVWSLQK